MPSVTDIMNVNPEGERYSSGKYREWWDTNYTRVVNLPGYRESSADVSGYEDDDGGWCQALQFIVEFGGWLEDDSWTSDAISKVEHRTKAWKLA